MPTLPARRLHAVVISALLAIGVLPSLCGAISLQDLTSRDAGSGLKAALSQGIDKAVGQLGASDGFLQNPKVAISLPPALEKVERALQMVGMGGEADALRTAMNRAAESAVSQAAPTFKKALRSMTLEDAKGIVAGGEDSATQYFRRSSADELKTKFRPIVSRATNRLKLANLYNQYAGKAAGVGLLSSEDADINEYVTNKALDGLFSVIADEEKAIRQDPLGQASSLIKKVFGAQ